MVEDRVGYTLGHGYLVIYDPPPQRPALLSVRRPKCHTQGFKSPQSNGWHHGGSIHFFYTIYAFYTSSTAALAFTWSRVSGHLTNLSPMLNPLWAHYVHRWVTNVSNLFSAWCWAGRVQWLYSGVSSAGNSCLLMLEIQLLSWWDSTRTVKL